MNIAIFGGSFDPPHIGHEKIVNKALKILDVDKLFIVPTYLNPFKTEFHFSPIDRFSLLTTLFTHNKIKVLDFEIKQNNSTPTIDTVNYIKEEIHPNKIYLIIGADNLPTLHLWKDFELLKDLVTFVVVTRDGQKLKNDIIQYIKIDMDMKVSSSGLRKHFDLKYVPKKIQKKVEELWKTE